MPDEIRFVMRSRLSLTEETAKGTRSVSRHNPKSKGRKILWQQSEFQAMLITLFQ